MVFVAGTPAMAPFHAREVQVLWYCALVPVAQVQEPVPAFFRIACRVEVIAIKQIPDPDLRLELVVDRHHKTKILGRQPFTVRMVERRGRCICRVLQGDAAFVSRTEYTEHLIGQPGGGSPYGLVPRQTGWQNERRTQRGAGRKRGVSDVAVQVRVIRIQL